MWPQISQVKYLERLNAAWDRHTSPRDTDTPTVISTFAGCGGSSLGYSIAGFRELLAVEWDEHAAATLRLNFPGMTVHHGDIAALSVDACLEMAGVAPGELDVFDGSPPCQGFSTAGKRVINDPRNQLFREFVRLLRGLQPRAFVMENVSGLVKGRMRPIFVEVLRELSDCGYRVRVRLLNASHYGVPQARLRLIFIGVRDDLGLEPSHPSAMTAPPTVWSAIGHLPAKPDPSRDHVWLDESPAGRNTRTWLKARCARPGDKFAGQKRRERWDRPASTLTTGGLLGMPYLRSIGCHPWRTRTYSLLEYKLLASFPEQFQFPPPVRAGYKRIGNSVPPLLMAAIAQHVREHILRKSQV